MFLEFSKKRTIAGVILSSVLVLLLGVLNGEFFNSDVEYGALLFPLCLICSLVCGAIVAINLNTKEKTTNILNVLAFFLLPFVSITMVECLNYVFVYNMYYVDFINNYILYLLFYGIVYAISGSFKASVMIINPLMFAFGLANYYLYTFRGSPFVPMDFLGITTAKGVADSYDFSPNYQITISFVLLVFIMVVGYKLKTPRMHISTKIISRISASFAAVTITLIYFFTNILANCGLEPDFWNQTRGYHNSGALLSFCLNTKYLFLMKPTDYDPNDVEKLMYSVTENSEETSNQIDEGKQNPDIICIMNESFADLSVCGKFTTNIDYMPFYNSLTENAVKGNLYVPVHGAGTSNTEYEFLTGNTTAFFPAGSNAYMLYVKNQTSSLVSTLTASGYSKTAFHPYYASGWNRNKVYGLLGFRDFYSITSVIKPSILLDYFDSGNDNEYFNDLCNENYPNQNVLLRQYVSDEYNYDKVISLYEERDIEKPFFLFNVTMQNHGGYSKSYSNLENTVKLTSTTGDYPKTEQFLSLMKKSDEAFEELINYFKNVDTPTVICMFGDHQPAIEESFYEEVMGVSSIDLLPLKESQKRYITPFIIWANYDIEEEYIDTLSANYLSSYLLKTANVAMPEYNKYLLNLSKQIPVISSIGCIDKDGNNFQVEKSNKYSSLLSDYKKIQYNNAIDKDNEKMNLFYN